MQDQTHKQASNLEKLLELGFTEECARKALSLSGDLEKASEIALKLSDEGLEADLSAYVPEKPSYQLPSKFEKAKMMFIVNGELKMGKGKICAQVGHAVIGAYNQIQDEARFDEKSRARLQSWNHQGTPKIVVKAETEKEMFEVKKKLEALEIGINTYLVEDAGHTQIKAGSKTVLGIGPAYSSEIDPITLHLKLL